VLWARAEPAERHVKIAAVMRTLSVTFVPLPASRRALELSDPPGGGHHIRPGAIHTVHHLARNPTRAVARSLEPG
jgi:hypothetical protein